MGKKGQESTLLALVIILLIGFVLRFSVFLYEIHDFNIKGDARNYLNMSQQLVDNGIYGYGIDQKSGVPNAYVTPVYPLFLSMVYTLTHNPYRQITLIRLFQIPIGGVLTPLLAFLLIARLFKRRSMALLTAFFIAIYPTFILSTVYILTEVLSLAAILLYFYLQTMGLQDRKPYLNLFAGAAFALNILIRPATLPLFFIPYIYAYFTSFKSDRKLLLKLFRYYLAAFAVVMLPWWLRNILALHKIVLLSTGSGDPLLAGTYPYMTNLFTDYTSEKVKVAEGAYAIKRIIKGFTTQPLLYLQWYSIGKIQYMFRRPWLYLYPPFETAALTQMTLIIHKMFVFCGLMGAVTGLFIKKIFLYIDIYALLMLVLLLIFIPLDRYAYQLMFFLMTASAFLIIFIADFIRKGHTIGKGVAK